jgi:hypothetical protein
MTAIANEQASLLDLIATDPVHRDDRAAVEAAIREDAASHSGQVDPNRVRESLTNEYGLTVYPRVIGATYSALRQAGVLIADGWTTSTDVRGGNAGKPARLYRLLEVPA